MPRKDDRRSTTLSISLTPELASEVSERVASGMYASASELLREALRLLLKSERATEDARGAQSERLASALDVQEAGLAMTVQRLRREHPDASEAELIERIEAIGRDDDLDVGLRDAPARLERLRLDEPD